MLFRPSKYDLNANEVELSAGELEANYMSENDEIDVCQVLIDFVNDQLPDFQHCDKCANKTLMGLYTSLRTTKNSILLQS